MQPSDMREGVITMSDRELARLQLPDPVRDVLDRTLEELNQQGLQDATFEEIIDPAKHIFCRWKQPGYQELPDAAVVVVSELRLGIRQGRSTMGYYIDTYHQVVAKKEISPADSYQTSLVLPNKAGVRSFVQVDHRARPNQLVRGLPSTLRRSLVPIRMSNEYFFYQVGLKETGHITESAPTQLVYCLKREA